MDLEDAMQTATRTALNLALADAVFVLVTTGVLPEALIWWVVRQLAEADAALAAELRPEAQTRFPAEEPGLTSEGGEREGARLAHPLLYTLTVSLDTLASTDREEVRATARRTVLEQLAEVCPGVAAVLSWQALVGQEAA